MPHRVRPATAADLEAIAELWAALLAQHAALDPQFALRGDTAAACERALRAMLADHRATVLVATEADALAGFACARFEAAPTELAEGGRAEITELYVHPDARRRGLGRVLVGAAADWVQARGAARAEVRVHAANEAGQAFWRALGFGDFVAVLARRL